MLNKIPTNKCKCGATITTAMASCDECSTGETDPEILRIAREFMTASRDEIVKYIKMYEQAMRDLLRAMAEEHKDDAFIRLISMTYGAQRLILILLTRIFSNQVDRMHK